MNVNVFLHAMTQWYAVEVWSKKQNNTSTKKRNENQFEHCHLIRRENFFYLLIALSLNCFQFCKYVGSSPLLAKLAITGFALIRTAYTHFNLNLICHAEVSLFLIDKGVSSHLADWIVGTGLFWIWYFNQFFFSFLWHLVFFWSTNGWPTFYGFMTYTSLNWYCLRTWCDVRSID